ncbi:class I adenylate-forming enzyme family protein [Plantactinospora sp. ZYX-F-223]|uniref:class I adenylate-forming enzyme family protein n=1 Tax=Plantactinospora sp. ZYX-F-223 TaxID=3144103 RepID=UPI0031FBBAFA
MSVVTREDLLRRRGARLRAAVAATGLRHLAVEVTAGTDLVVALCALRPLDASVVVVGPTIAASALAALRPQAVLDVAGGRIRHTGAADPGRGERPGGLWIFSSGTTGTPTPTHWRWHDLARGVDWDTVDGDERWGVGYAPFTYAGVEAVSQALGRAARIDFLAPTDLAAGTGARYEVVAGTPSFWRMAALHRGTDAARPRVDTVSMGGEPVDASLLRLVGAAFAPRRVLQIYASTELGRIATVTDGLPGLPLSVLDGYGPAGKALAIRDGELLVSPGPGAPYLPTGDAATIHDGRVHVLGRRGEVINVGGTKVVPGHVARLLQEHPEVVAARVYPVRSSVLGAVVGADIVTLPECDHDAVVQRVKAHARRVLAPAEQPRRVTVVDQIPMTLSGKAVRGG